MSKQDKQWNAFVLLSMTLVALLGMWWLAVPLVVLLWTHE